MSGRDFYGATPSAEKDLLKQSPVNGFCKIPIAPAFSPGLVQPRDQGGRDISAPETHWSTEEAGERENRS